jgi:hypothetical protein
MADLNDQVQNIALCDSAQTKNVTVITDGSIERLAVDADITGGNFDLQPFTPKVGFDAAGAAITTAWTTILNVTGKEGKLDQIACVVNSSNYQVRVTIDSVVIFTITMANLSALGLSNGTNIEMWVETADKNFRYHPNVPVDFTTNLKVEVSMTAGSGTLYYITHHREAA